MKPLYLGRGGAGVFLSYINFWQPHLEAARSRGKAGSSCAHLETVFTRFQVFNCKRRGAVTPIVGAWHAFIHFTRWIGYSALHDGVLRCYLAEDAPHRELKVDPVTEHFVGTIVQLCSKCAASKVVRRVRVGIVFGSEVPIKVAMNSKRIRLGVGSGTDSMCENIDKNGTGRKVIHPNTFDSV